LRFRGVSKCLGFMILKIKGFKISGFLNNRVSRFLGIKGLMCRGISDYDFLVSGILGFKVSELQGF
jgi:hypothetical protein